LSPEFGAEAYYGMEFEVEAKLLEMNASAGITHLHHCGWISHNETTVQLIAR
jgi:hypothetical protein